MSVDQLKKFINSVVDLHRDNFIQLLNNPEFQHNDLEKKERTVHYVSELFKAQLDESIQSLVRKSNGKS